MIFRVAIIALSFSSFALQASGQSLPDGLKEKIEIAQKSATSLQQCIMKWSASEQVFNSLFEATRVLMATKCRQEYAMHSIDALSYAQHEDEHFALNTPFSQIASETDEKIERGIVAILFDARLARYGLNKE